MKTFPGEVCRVLGTLLLLNSLNTSAKSNATTDLSIHWKIPRRRHVRPCLDMKRIDMYEGVASGAA